MANKLLIFLMLMSLPTAFAGRGAEEAKRSPKSDSDSKITGDASLLYMQGRQRVMDGKLEEALPLLEKALKADPENSFLNYQLGEIYLRLGNYDRSETLTKKAVEKEPSNVEYRATLGGIYASTKRYPEAKDQYVK